MQHHFLKYFFFYLFCLLAGFSSAQSNLVSNPSFEDIDSCYGDPSPLGVDIFQWSGCTDWGNPTYASSDLWCENPVFGSSSIPNILGFGFQYPKTGNKMAGIYITENIYQTYREYIQNRLLEPLKANTYYEMSFYSNSADTFNYSSDIGIYVSNNAISQYSSYQNFNYTPQIKNQLGNFIKDTSNWQKISGLYKALGGEQFITIGCFSDSSNIILNNYDTLTAGGVYLFIDDFLVEEAPFQLLIPNVFSPNNDGINDSFTLQIKNISRWICKIYNRWGQEIFEMNEKNPSWEGSNQVDGVYFYIFEGKEKEKEIKENGWLQLVR